MHKYENKPCAGFYLFLSSTKNRARPSESSLFCVVRYFSFSTCYFIVRIVHNFFRFIAVPSTLFSPVGECSMHNTQLLRCFFFRLHYPLTYNAEGNRWSYKCELAHSTTVCALNCYASRSPNCLYTWLLRLLGSITATLPLPVMYVRYSGKSYAESDMLYRWTTLLSVIFSRGMATWESCTLAPVTQALTGIPWSVTSRWSLYPLVYCTLPWLLVLHP